MKTPLTFAIGLLLACWHPNTAKAQSSSTGIQDSVHKTDTVILLDPSKMKIEIESEFPGGSKAWLEFLNSNLRYPDKAVRKNIEGTVILQFIVEKDGTISNLRAITGHPLLQEAALQAMAQSPKWIPATQNGRVVKSYKKQPIVFKLKP